MMDVNLTLLAAALALAPADDDGNGAVSGTVSGEVVNDEAAAGIGDRLEVAPTPTPTPTRPPTREEGTATTVEVGDRLDADGSDDEAAEAAAAAALAAAAAEAIDAPSSLQTA